MNLVSARGLAVPLFAGMLLAPPSTAPRLALAEPEITPPAATVPAAYWGRIDNVWTNFDVWRDGYKGMLIHVRFRTNGLLNSPCKAIAYFAYSGGSMIEDFNGLYTTRNGQVSSAVDFTPPYENTSYDDLQIFLPYSELHMGTGNHSLQYHVELYSTLHGSHFAQSQPVTFSFRMP